MRRIFRLSAGVLWLATMSQAWAAERFVPHGGTLNYPTIQAAVTASAPGDVVRVQPGVYNENITFQALDITLTSIDPSDSNVVQTTVIQGNGARSVVFFAAGQTTNTLFTGFTVRGGGGIVFSGYLVGGGIYCYQSSPRIVGNIIEENHLSQTNANLLSLGGAISCWEASPRIERNIIRSNSAYAGGAIVSIEGRPLVQDNWIYDNSAQAGAAAFLSDRGTFLNNTLFENYPDNLYVGTTGLVANNIIANSSEAIGVIANSEPGKLPWFQYNDVWQPYGTEILSFFQSGTNTSVISSSLTGTNGNISADPLFVNAANFDLHLSLESLCINAGDLLGLRSTNDLDIDGGPRIFALRVDIGASEFRGDRNFPPIANSGSDQTIRLKSGQAVLLNGSGSMDPEGALLTFKWLQTAGPAVALQAAGENASFTPTNLGEYWFELVVSDGVYDSTPDEVRIAITNSPPITSAGFGQSLAIIPEVLTLDGSHSMDPEGDSLVFHWQQTAGPSVAISDVRSSRPVFKPAGPGKYEFELTVSDDFSASPPDRVTFYLGQVHPVANPGPTRYAGRIQITLDGSRSFAPNSSASLEYSWRQISGPAALLLPTNAPRPVLRGFTQTTTAREMEFELVVSADGLSSEPATVKVIIVPAWNNNAISQVNPPFNTNRPSVFGFSGGNCDTGSAMSFPSSWLAAANVFTVSYSRDATSPTSDPRYFGYGDQLIVLLSAAAPAYDQPIQTIGFSTGCMPASDVAERFNILYRDSRYLVNRITFLDSGCSRNYDVNISNLASNRVPGKMFWIDNYYSSAGRFRAGTLNVEFPVPPADHGTPNSWYFPSWSPGTPYQPAAFNRGVFGGAFFSPVGPGKYYQLETGQSEYYFGWRAPRTSPYIPGHLVQIEPTLYPARLPGVVGLIGPTNGALAAARREVFSCQPVTNAVSYQILVGRNPGQVDRIAWEGTIPPSQPLSSLPFGQTWWTIRAFDAYGTASWATPRFVIRDSDRDNLSDEAEVLTSHSDPDNADTDGDGHLDGLEWLAGTDPFQPDAGLRLVHRLLTPGQLRLSWIADAGKYYDLEFSSTLDSISWQRIQMFTDPAAGGVIQHTVPMSADADGFYRLRSYTAPDN
jgi:hypothetical protein